MNKYRKTLEAVVWKHTHNDFRGKLGEHKTILVYRAGAGTCLACIKDLTDKELESKLTQKGKDELKARTKGI